MIQRAAFALVELIETIVRGCDVPGLIRIEASFDEFRVDLHVSYRGALLPSPTTRPSFEDIAASDDGLKRLSGFMSAAIPTASAP